MESTRSPQTPPPQAGASASQNNGTVSSNEFEQFDSQVSRAPALAVARCLGVPEGSSLPLTPALLRIKEKLQQMSAAACETQCPMELRVMGCEQTEAGLSARIKYLENSFTGLPDPNFVQEVEERVELFARHLREARAFFSLNVIAHESAIRVNSERIDDHDQRFNRALGTVSAQQQVIESYAISLDDLNAKLTDLVESIDAHRSAASLSGISVSDDIGRLQAVQDTLIELVDRINNQIGAIKDASDIRHSDLANVQLDLHSLVGKVRNNKQRFKEHVCNSLGHFEEYEQDVLGLSQRVDDLRDQNARVISDLLATRLCVQQLTASVSVLNESDVRHGQQFDHLSRQLSSYKETGLNDFTQQIRVLEHRVSLLEGPTTVQCLSCSATATRFARVESFRSTPPAGEASGEDVPVYEPETRPPIVSADPLVGSDGWLLRTHQNREKARVAALEQAVRNHLPAETERVLDEATALVAANLKHTQELEVSARRDGLVAWIFIFFSLFGIRWIHTRNFPLSVVWSFVCSLATLVFHYSAALLYRKKYNLWFVFGFVVALFVLFGQVQGARSEPLACDLDNPVCFNYTTLYEKVVKVSVWHNRSVPIPTTVCDMNSTSCIRFMNNFYSDAYLELEKLDSSVFPQYVMTRTALFNKWDGFTYEKFVSFVEDIKSNYYTPNVTVYNAESLKAAMHELWRSNGDFGTVLRCFVDICLSTAAILEYAFHVTRHFTVANTSTFLGALFWFVVRRSNYNSPTEWGMALLAAMLLGPWGSLGLALRCLSRVYVKARIPVWNDVVFLLSLAFPWYITLFWSLFTISSAVYFRGYRGQEANLAVTMTWWLITAVFVSFGWPFVPGYLWFLLVCCWVASVCVRAIAAQPDLVDYKAHVPITSNVPRVDGDTPYTRSLPITVTVTVYKDFWVWVVKSFTEAHAVWEWWLDTCVAMSAPRSKGNKKLEANWTDLDGADHKVESTLCLLDYTPHKENVPQKEWRTLTTESRFSQNPLWRVPTLPMVGEILYDDKWVGNFSKVGSVYVSAAHCFELEIPGPSGQLTHYKLRVGNFTIPAVILGLYSCDLALLKAGNLPMTTSTPISMPGQNGPLIVYQWLNGVYYFSVGKFFIHQAGAASRHWCSTDYGTSGSAVYTTVGDDGALRSVGWHRGRMSNLFNVFQPYPPWLLEWFKTNTPAPPSDAIKDGSIVVDPPVLNQPVSADIRTAVQSANATGIQSITHQSAESDTAPRRVQVKVGALSPVNEHPSTENAVMRMLESMDAKLTKQDQATVKGLTSLELRIESFRDDVRAVQEQVEVLSAVTNQVTELVAAGQETQATLDKLISNQNHLALTIKEMRQAEKVVRKAADHQETLVKNTKVKTPKTAREKELAALDGLVAAMRADTASKNGRPFVCNVCHKTIKPSSSGPAHLVQCKASRKAEK